MPFSVALLSKFPPLEGGIAAKTYWLARGLADREHTVHVITDPVGAGRQYCIGMNGGNPPQTPTIRIHRPADSMPWHLPEDNERTLALLDLTVRVIRDHNVQILDTGYLVPYGVIGHLAKMSTGVRHVVRHGGSDVQKFLKAGILETSLTEAIAQADAFITDQDDKDFFDRISSSVVSQPPYVVDEAAFRPDVGGGTRFKLAAIGKINYFWQHKRLDLVANIMYQLSPQFECSIIGQGNGISDLQDSLGPELVSSFRWQPFVPPWEMPKLLSKLDAVFIFESGLLYPAFSNLALEALSCGVGVITDRNDFVARYERLLSPGARQVLVVPRSDAPLAAKMISSWVEARPSSDQAPRRPITFQEYLSANEEIYHEVLK